MRVFAVSDVHVDFIENFQWVRNIPHDTYKNDALIVAGDVTHELQKLREFFVELLERFGHVTFVPGNHDLWVATSDAEHNIITSVDKFNAVIALCEELGVHTKPFKVGTAKPAWIVPMFAWYHEDFDDDMATRHEPIESWTDFNLCKWPREVLNDEAPSPSSPIGTPVDYFLRLNEPNLKRDYGDIPVITFSHFLPRRDVLPGKNVLFIKFLPKVVGTSKLDIQIRSIPNARVHVFGHTHILWNSVLDGIHYVQRSLKYPRERKAYPAYSTTDLSEMIVWDEDLLHETQQENMYRYLSGLTEKRKAQHPTGLIPGAEPK